MNDVEHEIETTDRQANKESVISSALPSQHRDPDDDTMKMSHLRQARHLGENKMILVGHNQVPVPKFDPATIEKYNKLNMEGKLPHIVETSHFNPDAVKQQVKEMLKWRESQAELVRQVEHHAKRQNMILESGQNPLNQHGHQLSSSGIGNVTPQTHSHEGDSMPFGESEGQGHPRLNKIPSFKKPEHFFGREEDVSPVGGI